MERKLDEPAREGEPLPRDVSRFRMLTPGDRAIIPEGATLTLAALTTRELIALSGNRDSRH